MYCLKETEEIQTCAEQIPCDCQFKLHYLEEIHVIQISDQCQFSDNVSQFTLQHSDNVPTNRMAVS